MRCICAACHRWMCLCKHGWEPAAHPRSTYLSIYCLLQTRLLVHVGVPSDHNTESLVLLSSEKRNLIFVDCLMLQFQDSSVRKKPVFLRWEICLSTILAGGLSSIAPPHGWDLDAAFREASPGSTSEKIWGRLCSSRSRVLLEPHPNRPKAAEGRLWLSVLWTSVLLNTSRPSGGRG